MTKTRLAIITSRASTDLYSDGDVLLPALEHAGVSVLAVPWGKRFSGEDFDAALIRTTWDYVDDRAGFLRWCAETAAQVPLANPAAMLRWNTEKTYLRDLERAGVRVVPTMWVSPGAPSPEIPWERFVVKPAVSAGGRSSASYARDKLDDAREHIEEITSFRTVAMVQPHIPSVDSDGETGTYVIGGDVTHAVHKGALLVTGVARVDDLSLAVNQVTARAEVTDEHAAFAMRVMQAVPAGLGVALYARVDTVRMDDGTLALLELELVEPFLFLEHSPEAADPVAAAIAAWVNASRRL